MITEEDKYELCKEYSQDSIDNSYNDELVYWCNHCKSLAIGNFECNVEGSPNLYCMNCNSFDISSGDIFEWMNLTASKDKVFKNLNEYKKYQKRIGEEEDSIKKEIEEEIESLYRLEIGDLRIVYSFN